MSTRTLKDLRAIQSDLTTLEGMVAFLVSSTGYKSNPEMVRNSLEVLAEFLAARTDRLDKLLMEVGG